MLNKILRLCVGQRVKGRPSDIEQSVKSFNRKALRRERYPAHLPTRGNSGNYSVPAGSMAGQHHSDKLRAPRKIASKPGH
jgi:hypothetical protein